MGVNIDDVIRAYIKLRDDNDAIEKRHKEELAPNNARMKKIEGWLQIQLQSQGLQSLKGGGGTAFLQTVSSVKVADWEATLKSIQENGTWELLDRRVSKSVVEDYLETRGEVPPGVEITRAMVVRIRRG